jgi:hypothetical protein
MGRWKIANAKPDTEYMRRWRETPMGRAYVERAKVAKRLYRQMFNERVKQGQKDAYYRVKLEAFTHYCQGDIKCACCSEKGIAFLTIDHIHGNGAAHRRQIDPHKKMGGNGFYYWLKKNNWPEGFQVLCANCNFAKRANKECPHQLMGKFEDYSI